MAQWIPAFDRLLEEAKKGLALNPTAVEAVAVITAKGNAYCLTGQELGSYTNEDAFFEMLARTDDTVVLYLTAMIQSAVDVPCFTFASRLVALNERNEDTLMLLQGTPQDEPQGELRYVAKPLGVYTSRTKAKQSK